MFHYQIFGIKVESELSLSELHEVEFSYPELVIRHGFVQESLDTYHDKGVFYQAAPGKFLFDMDRVGRFLVSDGKEIIVDLYKDANESEISLFLLGSVMGAAILQRGLTPLHGSTVAKDHIAFSICGKSGVGKSSLAAEYVNQGLSLVSDDISVVEISNENVEIKQGIQRIKLWGDSIRELGLNSADFPKVRSTLEKYYVPYTGQPVPISTRLKAILIIDIKNSNGFELKKLTGIEKFEAFRSNIYRGIYINPLGLTDQSFQTISRIIEYIDVYRITRPIIPLQIKELARFIDSYQIL